MQRKPFKVHKGVAAPLLVDNVDTDQIIPSREMRAVSRDGLGVGLFAGWRYLSSEDRTPDPAFVLNKPAYGGATILLSGSNFGCGSSREHAVWALADFGIRCVIAQSFGSIFFGNCARNGILAIVLPQDDIRFLCRYVEKDPSRRNLRIDLPAQMISPITGASWTRAFEVDPFHKRLLRTGKDPIELTLARNDEIEAFLERDRSARPWIYRPRRL